MSFFDSVPNAIFINLEDLQNNNSKFLDFLKSKYALKTAEIPVKIEKHTKAPDEKNIQNENTMLRYEEKSNTVSSSLDTGIKTDNFTNIAFCNIDHRDDTAARIDKLIEEILNSEIVYPVENDRKERMKYTTDFLF